jgi:hypothetical protein
LAIGAELVQEGKWKEAAPHFEHPEKEIYGQMRALLKTYDIPPFLTALQALAKAVKAKSKDKYATALSAVEERLSSVDNKLREKESNWPRFVTETVVETLRSAADEYEEAVKGGRVRNVVEYQGLCCKRRSFSAPSPMMYLIKTRPRPKRSEPLLQRSNPPCRA